MDKNRNEYIKLEAHITAWAAAEPALRALVVVGSRARVEHGADVWSDLDLILFTRDAERYVEDTAWIDQFGTVWARECQRTQAGDPEWLVVYAGGLKVDFFFAPKTGELSDLLFGGRYAAVAQRGVRVLLDKDSQQPFILPASAPAKQEKLTAEEFTAVSQKFHLYAYRTAMMLRRGDLWRTQTFINNEMRPALLTMLAWHAQAAHGLDYDTWYDGRFLETWADPRVVAVLPTTFARYAVADMCRALLALLDLFGWLMQETAVKWQYAYPRHADTQLIAWITAVLDQET